MTHVKVDLKTYKINVFETKSWCFSKSRGIPGPGDSGFPGYPRIIPSCIPAVGEVWSGSPWHLHGRLDSGRALSSVEEALQGSTIDGGMEGVREFGLRKDQVRWYREDKLKHIPDQNKHAWTIGCMRARWLVGGTRDRRAAPLCLPS